MSANRPDAKRSRWRKRVLARDGGKCVRCGKGRKLQAHHVLPYATHPERRFDVANGLTLCNRCHHVVHDNRGVLPRFRWDGRPMFEIDDTTPGAAGGYEETPC